MFEVTTKACCSIRESINSFIAAKQFFITSLYLLYPSGAESFINLILVSCNPKIFSSGPSKHRRARRLQAIGHGWCHGRHGPPPRRWIPPHHDAGSLGAGVADLPTRNPATIRFETLPFRPSGSPVPPITTLWPARSGLRPPPCHGNWDKARIRRLTFKKDNDLLIIQ